MIWLDEVQLFTLERREVITTDPLEEYECCGLPRDDDGFCIDTPHHPVYIAKR